MLAPGMYGNRHVFRSYGDAQASQGALYIGRNRGDGKMNNEKIEFPLLNKPEKMRYLDLMNVRSKK